MQVCVRSRAYRFWIALALIILAIVVRFDTRVASQGRGVRWDGLIEDITASNNY